MRICEWPFKKSITDIHFLFRADFCSLNPRVKGRPSHHEFMIAFLKFSFLCIFVHNVHGQAHLPVLLLATTEDTHSLRITCWAQVKYKVMRPLSPTITSAEYRGVMVPILHLWGAGVT